MPLLRSRWSDRRFSASVAAIAIAVSGVGIGAASASAEESQPVEHLFVDPADGQESEVVPTEESGEVAAPDSVSVLPENDGDSGASAQALKVQSAASTSPDFSAPVLTAPSKMTLPGVFPSTLKVTSTFSGVASGDDAYVEYPYLSKSNNAPSIRLVDRNPKMRSSHVQGTFPGISSRLGRPGIQTTFKFEVSPFLTPGKYRITVPLNQSYENRETGEVRNSFLSTTKNITFTASTAFSKGQTWVDGLYKTSFLKGKPTSFRVFTPTYHTGSKVTMFAKLTGQNKYKKVASGTVKASTEVNARSEALKVPGTYAKKGTRIYFQVSAAPYAPAYRTATHKVQ